MSDADTHDNDPAPRPGEGKGQVVGRLVPVEGITPESRLGAIKTSAEEKKAFEQAFFDALARKGEGLLTRYLYHDISKEDETKEEIRIDDTLIRHFGQLLYGAGAWDANMKKNKNYGLASGDMGALDYALEEHLVTKMPEKLHLIDYGAGGKTGAHKPEKLIKAVLEDGAHDISGYTAIDIVPRFASEAALSIHNEFNLHADIVVCDFMAAERVAVPKVKEKGGHTPVSLLFGGILANAPDMSSGGGPGSKENVVTYLSRMNRQHGPGSMVLMTYHAENDPGALLKEYQSTDELSAFVLSSFSRAVLQGTITDPDYDPFRYWHIVPRFDEKSKALNMCAVSLEDHEIPTARGPVRVEEGDDFTVAVSYKWDESDYRPMFEESGFEIVDVFRRKGAPRGLILARATRPPCSPAPVSL